MQGLSDNLYICVYEVAKSFLLVFLYNLANKNWLHTLLNRDFQIKTVGES